MLQNFNISCQVEVHGLVTLLLEKGDEKLTDYFKGLKRQEQRVHKILSGSFQLVDRAGLEKLQGLAGYWSCFHATNQLMLILSFPLLFCQLLEHYFQLLEMTQNVHGEVLLLAEVWWRIKEQTRQLRNPPGKCSIPKTFGFHLQLQITDKTDAF